MGIPINQGNYTTSTLNNLDTTLLELNKTYKLLIRSINSMGVENDLTVRIYANDTYKAITATRYSNTFDTSLFYIDVIKDSETTIKFNDISFTITDITNIRPFTATTLSNNSHNFTDNITDAIEIVSDKDISNKYYSFSNSLFSNTKLYILNDDDKEYTINVSNANSIKTEIMNDVITSNGVKRVLIVTIKYNFTNEASINIGTDTQLEYNILISDYINNCTLSPSTKSFKYNGTDNYILTLTPLDNYTFDTIPTIFYNSKSYDFTLSNNIATFDLKTLNINSDTTLTINATASINIDLTIDISELENATISPTIWNTALNAQNTIVVTPNKNYIFKDNPPKIYIQYENSGSEIINGTLNDDYSYTFEATNSDIPYSVSVDGVAVYIEPTQNYINVNTNNMKNVSFTEDSSKVFYTDLYAENNYKIKVNNGYIINGTPYLEIITLTDTYKENFIFDTDNNIWYINELTNYYTNIQSVAIFANAISETPILSEYQLIKVYNTDKNIVNGLRQIRFYNVNDNVYEDLGNYILSFVRYPFSVENSENDNIYLGFYKSNISSPTVNKQLYTISLGKFLINGIYKNENDVNTCKITANLKYYGLLTIDSKYINTEIEIKYITDIISNQTSIEVYSNDILVDRVNCSIGFSIPYILETERPQQYSNFSNNIKTLENIESQIIVEQNINKNNLFNVNKYLDINKLTGYNEINNINLKVSTQMTLKEIEVIKSILQSGVII